MPTSPARHGADIIQRGFEEFHESFRAITRRAKDRFESRDWVGIRRDTVRRMGLHTRSVDETLQALRQEFGCQVERHELWAALKDAFAYCNEAYEGVDDTNGKELIKIMGGDTPKLGALSVNNSTLLAQTLQSGTSGNVNPVTVNGIFAANLGAAAAILEEVHASGGNGAACHAQMYTMGTILRHGSDAQKERYLPLIASGELRLQAFGVTEPTSGTDTLSLRTTAKREGNDHYVINGQKIWTSRAEHSDLMLLLARTTPKEQAKKRTQEQRPDLL